MKDPYNVKYQLAKILSKQYQEVEEKVKQTQTIQQAQKHLEQGDDEKAYKLVQSIDKLVVDQEQLKQLRRVRQELGDKLLREQKIKEAADMYQHDAPTKLREYLADKYQEQDYEGFLEAFEEIKKLAIPVYID